MKNFEKFRSRALNSDALKEIKGGLDPTPECLAAYAACEWACNLNPAQPDTPSDSWYECLEGINCSPLKGWEIICWTDWG